MDPTRSSVRALLASLGLVATATPACSNGNAVLASSDAATDADASFTQDFGNVGCGSTCPPETVPDASGEPTPMDATMGADASSDADASALSPEAGGPQDASSDVDAVAMCCACGNAACCDPGCPSPDL
jgi:hypothetical protein